MAGGRSTAAAGRGRPILLPGRRTRGRDEQAKGRAKTLRRRHARAKAPGTCAHIPSLRRSPAPSSPALLPAVGLPIPPSFGGSPLLRPVFALSGGLPTALPRSLPSNDRSVGLSYPPSFVASPPEVRAFAQGVRSTRRGSEAVLCWSGGGVPRVHRRRPVMTQESSAGAAVSRRESEVGKQRQPTTTSCRHLR